MCTNQGQQGGGSAPDLRALVSAAPGSEVIAALDQLDPSDLSELDQLLLLEAWTKQQAWLAARTATATAAVSKSSPIDNDDFVREDIRAVLHLSNHASQELIDTARALHTVLPSTLAALEAGEITYAQVKTLVRATRDLSPAVAAEVEARVLDKAGALTTAQFGRLVAKTALAVDPQTIEEQHARAAARRNVVMYPGEAGMAVIRAELPAQDAQTIWLALTTLARQRCPEAAGHERPEEGIDARRADALTQLCANVLADPDLPLHHGRPVTLQVVMDLQTLLGLKANPAELVGYGPIPASVGRELAADASWQRLILEPHSGDLVHVGQHRYRPSQRLRDHVLARTPTCTFPGCRTPATNCDLDHTTPFDHEHPERGGQTSPEDLRPECRRHHRLKTHGGWTVKANADGSTTWTSPRGRTYHSPAADHRPNAPDKPGLVGGNG